LGAWTISLGSKKNRFNNMTVNYYDSSNGWQPNSIKVDNSAYLAADSNVLNEGGIDLPMVRTKADADRLGKFYLDQSRYTTVVNFKASHEALILNVNDVVYVDHETPGWTSSNKKKFRVAALVLNSDSTVEVTLMEYAPNSVYIENQ
jgi:predicted phage tail protein